MLAANQQLLCQHIAPLAQHMAVMLLQARQPMQARQPAFQAPPMQHLAIPGPTPFAGNGGGYMQGCNQGWSSRSNGQRRNHHGSNRHSQGHTPFADQIPAQVRGFDSSQGAYQQAGGINHAPPSLVKLYNNWNVCYSCGFDVENGHTLMTCLMEWRKPYHNVAFTQANAQSYILQEGATCAPKVCTRQYCWGRDGTSDMEGWRVRVLHINLTI
jgi:hypothetical protein